MARRKKRSRRKHKGKGKYCVTTTRKCATKGGRGCTGALNFSTTCYSSRQKAYAAAGRRLNPSPSERDRLGTQDIYSVNIHTRGRGR